MLRNVLPQRSNSGPIRLPSFLCRMADQQPNLVKIASNTWWLTFEHFLRLGMGILVSIALARYLGPEKFGFLSYAMSLASFFGAFAYMGLSGLVIRDLINHPEDKNAILGTTFALKSVGGITAFAILAIVSISGHTDPVEKWVILIIGLTLFFRPFETIDFWFYSQTSSKPVVLAKSISFFVTSMGKLLLVLLGATLVYFACFSLLEAALSSFFLILTYKFSGQAVGQWKVFISKAREVLAQSWILIISGILATVYLKIDQIMLRWMVGPHEVGLYSVAVTFSEIWYFIPAVIATSIYPTLIDLKNRDKQQYWQSLQKTMDILFLFAFIVALLLTLIGPKLILFLYGQPYLKTGYILMIHVWAGIFIFMRGLFSKWVLIENLLSFSLFTHGLGALTNIALNLLLIKWYAGYGAAFATLVSYAVASYFSLFFFARTRNFARIMTKSLLLPFSFILRPRITITNTWN